MKLQTHHRLALTGAVVTSAIALTDAITHGVTGGYSPFSEESDMTGVAAAGSLAHGLTYLALAAVLVREADRFRSTNRAARGSRWVVLVSLAVLAAGFIFVAPVVDLRGAYDGTAYTSFGLVAGPAFGGLILGSLVLGLALLRNRALGVGARVLGLMLPVIGLSVLLGWLASDWAHPAYAETTLHFGLALLGVGVAAAQPTTRAATASPTSAV